MKLANIFVCLMSLFLVVLYLSTLADAKDVKGPAFLQNHHRESLSQQQQQQQQQQQITAPKRTSYLQESFPQQQQYPIDRQLGDALIYPGMFLGNILPTALMLGLGYIIAKLLVIGLIAVKSSFTAGGLPGLSGGFLGHGGYGGYGSGGYGAGGYGAGGYGGYGGYGGGGYGGYGGWRSEMARSDKSHGKLSSIVVDIMNQLTNAMEKHEKVNEKVDKSSVKQQLPSTQAPKGHRRRR